ncbi:hypothetical protein H072_5924 [Dactylellina haptotyla CBS 200.50]|uniref:Uncharacterized protein n=1 Tax=Dactylellina haptotyla (strain CBS 200.50) TaxID=1284197 RepID=S8ABC9_DACHA|nr:hypothetical protein H072_5924 [Dactylellina haptotyla CBS 200.50]
MATQTHSIYTIGWICSLPKELAAATGMLDEQHGELPNPPNDNNNYTLGKIWKHNIVLACLPKGRAGGVTAAAVAVQMINTFPNIKFGLFVGIAGGVPGKGRVRLGDVVVSTPVAEFPGVVQWDMGQVETGGVVKRIGALNNPPKALLAALAKVETQHELNGTKVPKYIEELKGKYPRLKRALDITGLEDVLFRTGYGHVETRPADCDGEDDEEEEEEEDDERSCRYCEKSKVLKRKPREMKIHNGLIASGNKDIRDSSFRDGINKTLGGGVLCVDMEAAGLSEEFPCLFIKGICDYADSHKDSNKGWHDYAAAVAAAFAKELLEQVVVRDVGEELPVKDILGKIGDAVVRIEETVTRTGDIISKDEDLKILKWLAPIDHGAQQADYIKLRQMGTGKWLLDSEEFQSWLNGTRQTLFCPGIPGAGKTILTSIVIDHLQEIFGDQANVAVTYFYFNFKHKEAQKTEGVLASLLRQSIQHGSIIPPKLREIFQRCQKHDAVLKLDEMVQILEDILEPYEKVFVVIDALDEAEEQGGPISSLAKIFELQEKCNINIFATSRDIPEIKKLFETAKSLRIRATNEDLEMYITGRIFQLPKSILRSEELQKLAKVKIRDAAKGMFLLARLHLDSLGGVLSIKAVRAVLANLSTGYDSAYDNAMDRINGQMKNSRDIALQTLSWITHAERNLTPSELRILLAVEVGTSDFDEENLLDTDDMVSLCAGLVAIDEESRTVRLVHYTTQEYFERTWIKWFPDAQDYITKKCITYLSYDSYGRGLKSHHLPFYETKKYTVSHWGDHARKSGLDGHEIIYKFIESKSGTSAGRKVIETVQRKIFDELGFKLKEQPYVDPRGDPYKRPVGWRLTAEKNKTAIYPSLLQLFPEQISSVQIAAYFGLPKSMNALLSNGSDLNKGTVLGLTPLLIAIQQGHWTTVELLVDRGADLEAYFVRISEKALSFAVRQGNIDLVRLLINKGGEVEIIENGYLSLAASRGHDSIVDALLQRVSNDQKNIEFKTPLLIATEGGHESIVKILVGKGASLGARTKAMHLAISNGYGSIARFLIDNGADISSLPKTHRDQLASPTSIDEDIFDFFKGSKEPLDPDVKSRAGWTELHLAAFLGHVFTVEVLLKHGARIDARENEGNTPLFVSIMGGSTEVTKLLISNHCSITFRNYNGRTPFIVAAEYGNEAAVKTLINQGVDLGIGEGIGGSRFTVGDGDTYRSEVAVKNLIRTGVDLGIDGGRLALRIGGGRLALGMAIANGHGRMVLLLINIFADMDWMITGRRRHLTTPPSEWVNAKPERNLDSNQLINDFVEHDISPFRDVVISKDFDEIDFKNELVTKIFRGLTAFYYQVAKKADGCRIRRPDTEPESRRAIYDWMKGKSPPRWQISYHK